MLDISKELSYKQERRIAKAVSQTREERSWKRVTGFCNIVWLPNQAVMETRVSPEL